MTATTFRATFDKFGLFYFHIWSHWSILILSSINPLPASMVSSTVDNDTIEKRKFKPDRRTCAYACDDAKSLGGSGRSCGRSSDVVRAGGGHGSAA